MKASFEVVAFIPPILLAVLFNCLWGVDTYDAFSGEVPNKDKNEISTTSTDASVPFPTPSPIPAYA